MAQPAGSPKRIRFDPFEVDVSAAELRKHGGRLRLQEQPFQVLAALLENPGEVVTREDLIRSLWPDGTVVDFDRGLNAAVTRLRQALSDSAEAPRYVETVARRGYRFLALVHSLSLDANACGSTRCKTLLGLTCGGDHCGARNRGSLVVFGKTQDDGCRSPIDCDSVNHRTRLRAASEFLS